MGEDLTNQLYINGEWTYGTGGDVLTVVNPATEEVIGTATRCRSRRRSSSARSAS